MKFMIVSRYGTDSIVAESFDQAFYRASNSYGDALIAIIRIDLLMEYE